MNCCNFCVLVLFAHYGMGWDYLHIQISCNIINSQSLDRWNLERSCTNVEKGCANVSIAINYSFVHMFWEITWWVTLERSWTFVLNITSHSILLKIWRYTWLIQSVVKQHPCAQCHKSFRSNRNLNMQVYNCTPCNKLFGQAGCLRKRMLTQHSGEKKKVPMNSGVQP